LFVIHHYVKNVPVTQTKKSEKGMLNCDSSGRKLPPERQGPPSVT